MNNLVGIIDFSCKNMKKHVKTSDGILYASVCCAIVCADENGHMHGNLFLQWKCLKVAQTKSEVSPASEVHNS